MYGGSPYGSVTYGGILVTGPAPPPPPPPPVVVNVNVTEFAWIYDSEVLIVSDKDETASVSDTAVAVHQVITPDQPTADAATITESAIADHSQAPPNINPAVFEFADAAEFATAVHQSTQPATSTNYPILEYWRVDGVSLQTYAYNIATWGAARQAPPPLKGGNISVPFRSGSKWRRKSVASRVVPLEMWVLGAELDGTVSDRRKFETNWRHLRRMLWTPDQEVLLTKTFYDDLSNGLITASAKAQYANGLSPNMTGRTRASFVVDMFLADPFFYDSAIKTFTVNISSNTSITSFGDYPSVRMTITFTGPLTNPKLTNVFTGVWVQYIGVIASGETLALDVENFTAIKTSGSVLSNAMANITHSGDFHWMRLGGTTMKDSSNHTDQLDLSATGTGFARAVVTPIWL